MAEKKQAHSKEIFSCAELNNGMIVSGG